MLVGALAVAVAVALTVIATRGGRSSNLSQLPEAQSTVARYVAALNANDVDTAESLTCPSGRHADADLAPQVHLLLASGLHLTAGTVVLTPGGGRVPLTATGPTSRQTVTLQLRHADGEWQACGVFDGDAANPATGAPKLLSHSAVEHFIEQHLGAKDVVCNEGQDFPLRKNGATFTCTASGMTTVYTVTIKDFVTGRYVVQ